MSKKKKKKKAGREASFFYDYVKCDIYLLIYLQSHHKALTKIIKQKHNMLSFFFVGDTFVLRVTLKK